MKKRIQLLLGMILVSATLPITIGVQSQSLTESNLPAPVPIFPPVGPPVGGGGGGGGGVFPRPTPFPQLDLSMFRSRGQLWSWALHRVHLLEVAGHSDSQIGEAVVRHVYDSPVPSRDEMLQIEKNTQLKIKATRGDDPVRLVINRYDKDGVVLFEGYSRPAKPVFANRTWTLPEEARFVVIDLAYEMRIPVPPSVTQMTLVVRLENGSAVNIPLFVYDGFVFIPSFAAGMDADVAYTVSTPEGEATYVQHIPTGLISRPAEFTVSAVTVMPDTPSYVNVSSIEFVEETPSRSPLYAAELTLTTPLWVRLSGSRFDGREIALAFEVVDLATRKAQTHFLEQNVDAAGFVLAPGTYHVYPVIYGTRVTFIDP